jgi:hypothetical protein
VRSGSIEKEQAVGSVVFYMDENGIKRDGELHRDTMTDRLHELYLAEQAIRRNMADGMRFEKAVDLYATAELRRRIEDGVELGEALRTLREELVLSYRIAGYTAWTPT